MELKKYKKRRITPQGWKEITLAEVFNTSSGATPLSTEASYYENGTIPWINSGELASPYIYDTTNFISQAGFENSSTEIYPIDTVLVAMYGATAGKASLLKMEACTNQAICAILPNKDYSSTFLKYSIDTLYDHLVGLSSGSARDNLSQAELKKLKLIMPPTKNEQNKLVSILASIDRKIELNRAINQNLEAMAKQLYDYWFVQFDFPNKDGKPYKSSGGEMVWNEKLKREIPKEWNVLKLGEHCSFNKRTSNGYFNHPILYLDTSNITNNTIDELQFLNPSSDIIPSRARRLVQEGDIVYSTVRPNLKHFGIIMNPDYNMVVSTGFAVITANWSAYRYFIYQFLIQAATIENLSTIAQSAVSAYPSINTSDIENLDLVVPPDSMIEKYAKTACRLYLQIDTNYKEIKSLTKQRDELLPLLMNGQVSVNSDLSDD
jgi:type I restriction enzyme S subunit